ncbi:hypothetical protein RMR21_004400 [Agrobacterium sp. rho-8.1]|nr:hypothetical protein [Agrobacterium sp. rho-8.1]
MQKVSHYRRAMWPLEGRSVEQFIKRALDNAPNVSDTKFIYQGDVTAQITMRDPQGRGLGLYFTLFSEGGATGTVENGGSRIGRANAPAGTEFLKTGIHMILEGNHLAFVANGQTNDGQITRLLAQFLNSKGIEGADTQFVYMPRSNRRELERLLSVGVKSIDLGVTSFLVAAEEMAAANPRNNLAQRGDAFMNAVRGLFGEDRTPEEIEAASDIQAKLHLGYDGRSASYLVPQILGDLATQVTQGPDEFKIITTDDTVITRDKLVIKRDVNIEGDEIALDHQSAFAALRESLSGWRATGIMEE